MAASTPSSPPRRIKPRVAVVYTGHAEESAQSYNFAHYFGACLYLAGYSSVRLIPFGSSGQSKKSKKSKAEPLPEASSELPVVPYGEKKVVKVEQNDDFRMGAELKCVKECQLVQVCVNPLDTEKCGAELARLLPKQKNIGIFCLQYGVKNYVALEPWCVRSGPSRALHSSL